MLSPDAGVTRRRVGAPEKSAGPKNFSNQWPVGGVSGSGAQAGWGVGECGVSAPGTSSEGIAISVFGKGTTIAKVRQLWSTRLVPLRFGNPAKIAVLGRSEVVKTIQSVAFRHHILGERAYVPH